MDDNAKGKNMWKLIFQHYSIATRAMIKLEVNKGALVKLTANHESAYFSLAELENALEVAHDFIESEE